MPGGAWPDVRVPAPLGPSAREHLEQTRKAARRAKPPNLRDIEAAISACLDGKCLQGGNTPRRGRPPPDGDHGADVLLARAHAAAAEWDLCLALLAHGEEPREPPGRARAAKA